jgi:hypothetical protein
MEIHIVKRTVQEYHHEAMIVEKSVFTRQEKNRHFKELLVKMRSQYGQLLHDEIFLRQNRDVLETYNRIASLIVK